MTMNELLLKRLAEMLTFFVIIVRIKVHFYIDRAKYNNEDHLCLPTYVLTDDFESLF